MALPHGPGFPVSNNFADQWIAGLQKGSQSVFVSPKTGRQADRSARLSHMKLRLIETGIETAPGNQTRMSALLDNPPLINDQNSIYGLKG